MGTQLIGGRQERNWPDWRSEQTILERRTENLSLSK